MNKLEKIFTTFLSIPLPMVAGVILGVFIYEGCDTLEVHSENARKSKQKGVELKVHRDINKDGALDYTFDNGHNVFISEKMPDGSFKYNRARLGRVDDLREYRFEDGSYMTLEGITVKNQGSK